MSEDKPQEGAGGGGAGGIEGDARRPSTSFDPRELTREVLGSQAPPAAAQTPSSAFKRPTASAVEAARPPSPTLTDPIELEAARIKSTGGPPSSELSMVNRNSPSLAPPTSAPISLLDDGELSPLDRGWLEDEIETAGSATVVPDEARRPKSDAPTSPPPSPAPKPAEARPVAQTTDDMFAELALEDDGLDQSFGAGLTLDADTGMPSIDPPPLLPGSVPPPPETRPVLDDLVAREPSAVLGGDEAAALMGREPSAFAMPVVSPEGLVAREPSGLVAAAGGRPTPVATTAASPKRADMKERFALGDFTGALEIAESLLAEAPDDAEVRACAEESREVLIQMYTAKLGSLDRVPLVMVPREQLRWLSIDHRAGFVLSHIDGMSNLEMILDVSGMPPLDAMRILCELHQQRIISFR